MNRSCLAGKRSICGIFEMGGMHIDGRCDRREEKSLDATFEKCIFSECISIFRISNCFA